MDLFSMLLGQNLGGLNNPQAPGIKLLDHTVKFLVDEKPYEIISVKDGNSVNAPLVNPNSERKVFLKWKLKNNEDVVFPYTPVKDIEMIALFSEIQNTNALLSLDGYILKDKNGLYLTSREDE
jgi:hypothetical protein